MGIRVEVGSGMLPCHEAAMQLASWVPTQCWRIEGCELKGYWVDLVETMWVVPSALCLPFRTGPALWAACGLSPEYWAFLEFSVWFVLFVQQSSLWVLIWQPLMY